MKQQRSVWGNKIDWNHVFYFSEVAACGSIKEAASKLDLSPSTLSTHISQLEKDLALSLFHRHHRKITLTPQGVRLFQYAKQMFETGRRLIDVVSPVALGSYPISIGLVPCPSMPLAYRLVTEFLTSYDPVNIRVSQTKHEVLEKGLSDARFDFGFSRKLPERKDISHQLVSCSPLNLYVAEHLAKEDFSSLISRIPMVICGAESGGLDIIDQLLEQTELSPRSIVTSDYPGLVFEFCKKGNGIGIFSDESIQKLDGGSLHFLRTPRGAPTLTDKLYVLWPKDSDHSKAIGHLNTLLSNQLMETQKTPKRQDLRREESNLEIVSTP